MKIAIFCEIKDSFFHKFLNSLRNKIKNKNKVFIFTDYNQQKINCDLAFFVSCRSKILKKNLIKNKLNLVVHPSKLPEGKGSGVVAWKILENKKKLWISFFEPELNNLDNGRIFCQDYFLLKGNELCDEIRAMQAAKTIEMCEKIISKLKKGKINPTKQKKVKNKKFYRIRSPIDSKININLSIKSQFNLLRVVDNERYPAYFIRKGVKYILKIYKK
tara:strand:- start:276 stop:926 length:651 start_codon:yes stop_codon:yes gene_type:complete